MLTIIGKHLVHATVIFSVAGLGLSLWAAADPTDFKGEMDRVNKEISRLKTAEDAEKQELKEVLDQAKALARKIPRGPDEIAGNKDVTVTQALEEIAKIEKDLPQIFDQVNQDNLARIALGNELQSLRSKLQAEKEIGSDLRKMITPEPVQVQQGQRAPRDVIASLQVAKDEVERRTEAMQPDLYNAAIRLQSLMLRNKGLKQRMADLSGSPTQ